MESTETSKRLRGVHGNPWLSVKCSVFLRLYHISYHLLILLAISIISLPDAESALDKIYYMEYEHPAAHSNQILEAS